MRRPSEAIGCSITPRDRVSGAKLEGPARDHEHGAVGGCREGRVHRAEYIAEGSCELIHRHDAKPDLIADHSASSSRHLTGNVLGRGADIGGIPSALEKIFEPKCPAVDD